MSRYQYKISGAAITAPVLFLILLTSQMASAESSPVAIESRGIDSASELPFRRPVSEDPEMAGIEREYQMQLLQQEVQELRGIVELLQYELAELKVREEERYLELDARYQHVRQIMGGTAPVINPDDLAIDVADASEMAAAPSVKKLYDTGLELIRNRQYDQAVIQLKSVIDQFPEGAFAANAYYWLGEVYAAKPEPNYEEARQALTQVITFFPSHRKVPDAAFKLGKVYHLMGDCVRATELLNQVVEQHSGKSVSKLAETYLKDKVNCENE